MTMFGLGYMSLSLSTGSILQYWTSWVVIAVFGVGATPIISTRAVNTLFSARRGLALGITLMGSGILLIVLKSVGSSVIEAIGWRASFAALGALPVLIAAPATLWGFPGKRTEPANSAKRAIPAREQTIKGISFKTAIFGWRFWLIAASFLPVGLAGAAPIPNLENILRSDGVPANAIASITPLVGVALLTGRLCGGYIIDRVWAPLVTFTVAEAGAVACFLLSRHGISHGEAITAVFLLGLTAGVELDLLAYTVVRYLGLRSYGSIYGTLYGLFYLTAGAGPSMMAHSFDATGGYSQIMLQACGAMAVAGLLILFIGPYPRQAATASAI
jgi:predicted MFS family arabinose efflux permease